MEDNLRGQGFSRGRVLKIREEGTGRFIQAWRQLFSVPERQKLFFSNINIFITLYGVIQL